MARRASGLLPRTKGALFILALALPRSFVASGLSSRQPPSAMPPHPSRPRNIVVCGGGIQGTSVAYHLAQHAITTNSDNPTAKEVESITILEAKAPASAASGKGGGFMARSWGDGSPTQRLHELAFDLYEKMAPELGCQSYRKIPVLSVSPGTRSKRGVATAQKDRSLSSVMPSWLDGETGPISALGLGDDTAQITPAEFVSKMLERHKDRIRVVLGTCTGVETEEVVADGGDAARRVTAVNYVDQATGADLRLPCDAFVVSNGPWACQAEDWFPGSVQLPMEGVKSTSIVWEPPKDGAPVDATALFCGEDSRYGTHLEVYPRPDGTVYLCGIGGSDYVPRDALKRGAFRDECLPKPGRVDAATSAFTAMSRRYRDSGRLAVTQACMRPCPPDALPYMGRIPGHDGAYINAGHNCWGIAWAPATGKAMAELILEGRSRCVDLSPFDPGRYTPSATQRGNRGRKQRGVNVGEQW